MTTSTSIKLDDDLKARIQRLAEAKDRTSHWIMREAIEEYVDRQEKREKFMRDAQESWEEYQRTGRHLTWDEVSGWLKKVGTDEQTEFPKCHE